jgi:hypothetical protein
MLWLRYSGLRYIGSTMYSDKFILIYWTISAQGLYEYARPAWEERPRPQVEEFDLKKFGATTQERPSIEKNADHHDIQANGVVLPRYWLFYLEVILFKVLHIILK